MSLLGSGVVVEYANLAVRRYNRTSVQAGQFQVTVEAQTGPITRFQATVR
jgi:hypothetical protein